jgi:predicted ATP-dependent protease
VKEIILPAQNKKDLEEIPPYIKKGLKFHPVASITDVIGIAFTKQRKGESGDGGKKPDGRHRNKRSARGLKKG